MSIILSKDPKEIVKILKKLKEHVFKITKETIFAIPEQMVSHYKDYNDFLKFAKENPKKVFTQYYHIMDTILKVEEI